MFLSLHTTSHVLLMATLTACFIICPTLTLANEPIAFVEEIVRQAKAEGVTDNNLILSAERELQNYIYSQKFKEVERKLQQEEERKRPPDYWVRVGKKDTTIASDPQLTLFTTEAGLRQTKEDRISVVVRITQESANLARTDLRKILRALQKTFCPSGGTLPPEVKDNLQQHIEQILNSIAGLIATNSDIPNLTREVIIGIAAYLVAIIVNHGVEKFCTMPYPAS